MSAALISRSPDLQQLDDEGFELEIRGGYLLVHAMPYVGADRSLGRGILVCALTLDPSGQQTTVPADHTAYFVGGVPCNRDGSPLGSIINNSNTLVLGDGITVNHYLSSKPEQTGKYSTFYEKVVAYEGHMGRAARSIDKGANARTGRKVTVEAGSSPFRIPDTASARYGIGKVNRKLALHRVAIIGLGGTGSYILDLLAKTGIQEIHLFDDDQLLSHNFYRAPGAPASELVKDFPTKVAYYLSVYDHMHAGIHAHPVRVDAANVHELQGFDFVFVCVDKGSARRLIAENLHRMGVPFIDTGIGVGQEDDELDGNVRVTLIEPSLPWSDVERLLSFGDDDDEDDEYRTHIQIADLNSLNATLAVLRWKRWIGFYRDSRGETNSAYMVEGNFMSNRRSGAED